VNTLGNTTIKSLFDILINIQTNKLTYWVSAIIKRNNNKVKAYVQLVLLGFDVTTFTPIAYQRDRLSRHLKVNSS
jgi:hypothetical protein